MIDEDKLRAFDAREPLWPYTVMATQRRPGNYVSGLALTPFERQCARGGKCWVVYEDHTGWKVVLFLGTGYWFHEPPANLLKRLLARTRSAGARNV
jgi:hypothetical protein